ncbi:MAG: hypothetical protein Q9185_004261 [Variospora sp. 1 TL-2023]
MLPHSLVVFCALCIVTLAIDLSVPLSCHPKDQLPVVARSVLAATITRRTYGSVGPQGSSAAQPSRCPRAKPTVTITVTVSSGTTSVPTSPGFTPILSETYSVSFNPYRRRQLPSKDQPSSQDQLPSSDTNSIVVSIDHKGQVTTSADEAPKSMICGPETTSSMFTPAIPTYCSAVSTATTTATITVAATNTYDACAANNLVGRGLSKGAGQPINQVSFVNATSSTAIDAASAYDCCVACQKLGCVAGSHYPSLTRASCDLYFQDDCDPTAWTGSTFAYQPANVAKDPYSFTVFNGPCGQIVYGGSSVCKDPPCA